MNKPEIRATVLAELKRIAPEIEESELAPASPLREQVDLDSMDWLNFLVALHERLKVDIPEADYARLGTLDQTVDYLARKLGAR
ncbi:MAG: phosphopantetheine-binding protein [Betaproteobacteria bacterium RIFCSPLOWO2_12_FULL_65_14]|nr:MAG: phosphopantetheine-binding protein [Betaproteobacteria bacterium RIFCSPLOWO2_12_FULL_65_14]